MALVKAQCTNCNGLLEVDNSNDAAVCPFCGTPYVIEKAINNYIIYNNTTVIQDGVSKEETQKNGFTLLKLGDYKNAFPLFSKLVQVDPNDWKNWFGLSFCENTFLDLNDLKRAESMAPFSQKDKLKAMCSCQDALYKTVPPVSFVGDNMEHKAHWDFMKNLFAAIACGIASVLVIVLSFNYGVKTSDYDSTIMCGIFGCVPLIAGFILADKAGKHYKAYKGMHIRNQAVQAYYSMRDDNSKQLIGLAQEVLNMIELD